MQKCWKVRTLLACSVAFVGALLIANVDSAQARPLYLKGFIVKYDGLADQAKKVKCGICHPEKSKKVRGPFGKALMESLGDKNVKDAEKIKKALGKAEKKKSEIEGKTFGDLIKAGKLPNAKE